LGEIVERMRSRLTSSGYGVGGQQQQQQQQGGSQGVGPSYGGAGAGAGGGYGYAASAGVDIGRPMSHEERAVSVRLPFLDEFELTRCFSQLLLVQQIVERAPTTGFTLADLQILVRSAHPHCSRAGFADVPPHSLPGSGHGDVARPRRIPSRRRRWRWRQGLVLIA